MAEKVKAKGYFSKPKYIELTAEEKEDAWQVAVWIYKGLDQPEKKRKLAKIWDVEIYNKWPHVEGKYKTPLLLRKLWETKNIFLIK